MSPGSQATAPHLRINELISGPESFLKHVAARMIAGFALIEFSISQQPADMRVIVSELLDDSLLCRQVINPAIADMAEIHPARREPAEAQGRFHAATFFVAASHIGERAVNLAEQLRQHVGKTGFQTERG